MFKYTPPWQVLCHSLEHNNNKRRSETHHDARRQAKILNGSIQTRAPRDPVPAEAHRLSRITMTSVPKRWVMKPLTPRLEKSDLRTLLSPGAEPCSSENSWSLRQNGDSHTLSFDNIPVSKSSVRVMDGESLMDVVHAKQVTVSEDSSTSEDWQPSTPNSPGSVSSTDCHQGFYSFVDDPISPEAEKNEVYMVSPKRQAKLSTLLEKSSFKLQTYMEERRPEKLFHGTNGDDQYYVDDVSGDDNEEEKPDRMEIIRSQAPKKNIVFKEQWSSLENLDLTTSPQSLVEGFSLCFSPGSSKPLQSDTDPGTIDNQQIDFNAARQQFQLMEQTKQNPFWRSSQESLSPKKCERSLSAGAKLFTTDFSKTQTPKEHTWRRPENKVMPFEEDLEDTIQPSSADHIGYGLETHGVDSSSVGNVSTEPAILDSIPVDSTSETPIEREIRIAQEREQDLRRLRGIYRPDASEMVEIKTKPILSLPTPQIKPIKTKEPNRVSLLIQRENQRVHENQGLYDRGSQGERKITFGSLSDQLDVISSSKSPSINPTSRSIVNPVHVEQRDVCDAEEPLSPCCPHRHPDETMTEREMSADVSDRSPNTKWKAEKEHYKAKTASQPFWMADYKPKESRKTALSPPAFPPEPECSSRSPGVWRSFPESVSEWPRMSNAPDIIRREIEENLRREQELQKQRETKNLISDVVSGQRSHDQTPLMRSDDSLVEAQAVLPQTSTHRTSNSSPNPWSVDPTPVSCHSEPGPQSKLSSFTKAQPWSGPKHTTPVVHRVVPTIPSSPLSETSSYKGLTKTLLNDFEERRVRLKLEESSYAGIQPVDDINNEVVEVTRVTRHKNTRALQWEAGVYANEENC